MDVQLEKELSRNMTENQWEAFKTFAEETGLTLDENCLNYGSKFLNAKMAFLAGWEASSAFHKLMQTFYTQLRAVRASSLIKFKI